MHVADEQYYSLVPVLTDCNHVLGVQGPKGREVNEKWSSGCLPLYKSPYTFRTPLLLPPASHQLYAHLRLSEVYRLLPA